MCVWSAHMYTYLYVCQGAGQRVNVFLISLHFIYSDRVSHLNPEFADWTIPVHPREPLSLPRLQVSHHTCLAFRRVLGIQTLVLTQCSHTFSLSHLSSPCGLSFKSVAHFIIGPAPLLAMCTRHWWRHSNTLVILSFLSWRMALPGCGLLHSDPRCTHSCLPQFFCDLGVLSFSPELNCSFSESHLPLSGDAYSSQWRTIPNCDLRRDTSEVENKKTSHVWKCP